jgi:hypothetical protein
MSDHIIARNCAPTLAGLKTGSMFTTEYADRQTLARELFALNTLLTKYGLRALLLRCMKRRALIYLYRPDALEKDLLDPAAAAILRERGYHAADPKLCLGRLVRQFRQSASFPHEVGLFLGYPPEDVRGFIQSPHSGYRCVGCWKVYGDEEKAKATFEKYEKCKNAYCMLAGRGRKACELAVCKGGAGNN